jgi:hypothetical protein
MQSGHVRLTARRCNRTENAKREAKGEDERLQVHARNDPTIHTVQFQVR